VYGVDPLVLAGLLALACILCGTRLLWGMPRKKHSLSRSGSAAKACVGQQFPVTSDSQIAELPDEEVDIHGSFTEASRGRSIPTMIGRVAFMNPHAEGRFGDWLTAQYFTRRLKRPYAKLKSKLPGERGIDGVYRRYHSGRENITCSFTYEILIVENKINSGALSPGQLSVEWIRLQCDKMMRSGDRELLDTAAAILHALSKGTGHKSKQMLVTHDLVSGMSTRHHVDESGNKRELLGQWDNRRAVRRSLERKLEQGEVRLADYRL